VAAVSALLEMVRAQKRGEPRGIPSICSANRFVVEAAMLQAADDDDVVLIEATSNQVNAEGGYTGMKPADFVGFVRERARGVGLPFERVLLGGDHLGPFPFAHEPARTALDKAREMVRQYVRAGFTKIHLDTSMRCADDPPGALADETITERTADLVQVAEDATGALPEGSPRPLYGIGTEVPVPGGEQDVADHLAVTRREDAERTLALARAAFSGRGLAAAWDRVIGLVVQPGVEFGDTVVFDYDRARTGDLRDLIRGQGHVVYEAHSTDYQTEAALGQLVEDHFGILKVGPGLTFAFREAVFALAAIEQELLGRHRGAVLSDIREVLERVMLAHPASWRRYYQGDDEQRRLARAFSLSDRIRYYWPRPEVEAALARLLANLAAEPIPPTLLSQYLPGPWASLRGGRDAASPVRLIHLKIREVTSAYSRACRRREGERAGC
jgi:D-tagatose-1,6-bisphosphate aldolase subunit GatZ/KbaZ